MKKRSLILVLVLGLLLALAVPGLAAEETPAVRLSKVTVTSADGPVESTFVYDDGGWLPTQVQKGADACTVEYDDAGRMLVRTAPTAAYQYAYDEAGQLTELAISDTGSGVSNHIAYSYDEAGLVVRAEATNADGQGGSSTTVTENTYDEHGNQTSSTASTDGGESSVSTYSYEYDDAGLAVSQTYNISQPWGDFTGTYTYTYDDQGRRTGESYDDGEIRYYYMPLLRGEWDRIIWTDFVGETTSTREEITMTLALQDAAGQDVVSWSLPMTGEPTLEYDEDGCLVRVADADGSSIELAYEPVA